MRRITITGSAILKTWGDSNIDHYESTFKQKLAASGWRVVNLDFRATGWLTITGVNFAIYVEADVPDEYTNQQHQDHFAELLNNYELCLTYWGGNCGRVITDVNLMTTGADKPGATPIRTQPGKKPNQTGIIQTGLPPTPTIPNSTFDAFASSLGLSTPVAIVGGAILLILILRR